MCRKCLGAACRLILTVKDLSCWLTNLKYFHAWNKFTISVQTLNKLTWFKHLISSPLFSRLGYFEAECLYRGIRGSSQWMRYSFGPPLPWVHTHTHSACLLSQAWLRFVGVQSVNYCEKHFMWIEGWTEMEKASKQAGLCWGWER